MRGVVPVLATALAVASLASPVLTEPLTEAAKTSIESKLFGARLMSNAEAALQYCREAELQASKYDRDPLFDGAIAKCIAVSSMNLVAQSRHAACFHFERALDRLAALRADHPRFSEAKDWMDRIQRDRAGLGC